MKNNVLWAASEFGLWHVREHWLTYLGLTELAAFETGGDAPLRACAYCSSLVTNGNGNCSQCGAPLGYSGPRIGTMVLRSLLPEDGGVLTGLRSGDHIELHHACCGRRDDYSNGHCAISLTIGDIEGPRLANLAPFERDYGSSVIMEIVVRGPVQLNLGGEAGAA